MLPFNLHSFNVYEFTCANCDACSLSEDKKSHIQSAFKNQLLVTTSVMKVDSLLQVEVARNFS